MVTRDIRCSGLQPSLQFSEVLASGACTRMYDSPRDTAEPAVERIHSRSIYVDDAGRRVVAPASEISTVTPSDASK